MDKSGTSSTTFVSVDLSRLGFFFFFVQRVLGLFCKSSPHMSGFALGLQSLSFPLLLTVKVCRHGGRLKKARNKRQTTKKQAKENPRKKQDGGFVCVI